MSVASEIYSYASVWKQGCSHELFDCPKCDAEFIAAVERVLDRRDQRALLLQQRETAFGTALVQQTFPMLGLMLEHPHQSDSLLRTMKELTENCSLTEHLKIVDKILAMVDE